MAFELPPNGSHGAWMPRVGLLLRGRALITASLYRLTLGHLIGRRGLLLTTIGARSGRRRTTLVRRFDDGDGRWLVVASAAGAAKHPGWLVNLSHHPDQAWVELRRDRFMVRPELLLADERALAWPRIVAEAPQFAGYQRKTDREIPVVRLSREASS
jgi:deazaflavin-dependent oxidoreductase (nitroreductase family)